MNKVQLEGIILRWAEWNSGEAQTGEPYQFESQIRDWNSGFKRWQSEGFVGDTSFDIVRCKAVSGGLSIRLESGTSFADGILKIESKEWIEKTIFNDSTGSMVMRGASIDG